MSISRSDGSSLGKESDVAAKLLDYDKFQDQWIKLINRQPTFQTDILAITSPRTKLDPIAKKALEKLCDKLTKPMEAKEAEASKAVTADELEKKVRAYIVRRGIASKVNQVTQRLNARRMTEGRRWVLAATYVYLLAKLFKLINGKSHAPEAASEAEAGAIQELIKDDLGVADKLVLDLEADDGPIDVFAKMIVDAVMELHNLKKSKMLRNLVAQQVRSTI